MTDTFFPEAPWVNGPAEPRRGDDDEREAALEDRWERERDERIPDGGSEG